MKGYLHKKQPKALIWGKWKPRYCVLKKDKFKYYDTKESINHLGVIDFNKVEASAHLTSQYEFGFKITVKGCDKEFIFRANNSKDAETWVKHLEVCIAKSKGKHLGLSISDSKFWKDEYISKYIKSYINRRKGIPRSC